MKNIFFSLTLVLTISCSSKHNPVDMESDVYISSFDTTADVTGKSILKNEDQRIYFSKDFWNYFIRTHPKTSNIIFLMPLYDTANNYVSLPDTSYYFYNISVMSSFYFEDLLADSVTGHEKQFGSFFIIPDDTIEVSAKDKRIEQNLKDYKITPTVKKEFERMKKILNGKDTSEQYVVVFKKSFTDKIYRLYE